MMEDVVIAEFIDTVNKHLTSLRCFCSWFFVASAYYKVAGKKKGEKTYYNCVSPLKRVWKRKKVEVCVRLRKSFASLPVRIT